MKPDNSQENYTCQASPRAVIRHHAVVDSFVNYIYCLLWHTHLIIEISWQVYKFQITQFLPFAHHSVPLRSAVFYKMRFSTLLGLLPLTVASPVAQRSEPAPLYTRDAAERHNADKYIVKFKEGSVATVVQDALAHVSAHATHHFQHVFQGFAAKLDSRSVEMLRLLPDVRILFTPANSPVKKSDRLMSKRNRSNTLKKTASALLRDMSPRATLLGVSLAFHTVPRAMEATRMTPLPVKASAPTSPILALTKGTRYDFALDRSHSQS